jgi:hypothetical protein
MALVEHSETQGQVLIDSRIVSKLHAVWVYDVNEEESENGGIGEAKKEAMSFPSPFLPFTVSPVRSQKVYLTRCNNSSPRTYRRKFSSHNSATRGR